MAASNVKTGRHIIWLAVAGLLLYFGLRIHNLDAVPLFIDETIEVQSSLAIVEGTYLHHAPKGKFSVPYYFLPFQPRANAVIVIRTAMVIWSCLGFAAGVATAQRCGGTAAAVLTVLLLTFSPMLFFFGRFAISDTMANSAVTVWVWSLFRVYDISRPNYRWVAASGIIFFVCLLAKATTILILPLPIVFAILFAPWAVSIRMKATVTLYAVIFALWIPFALALSTRNLDYFGHYGDYGASTATMLNPSRIADNLSFMLDVVVVYHGAVMLAVCCVIYGFAIYVRPRITLTLLAAVAGFGCAIALLTEDRLFARYFVPVLSVFLVGISISVVSFSDAIQPRLKPVAQTIVALTILIWIVLVAAPFIQTVYDDPADANLYWKDFNEYIGFDSSGFGIPELAQYLVDRSESARSYVVGAFVGCETLRLYLSSPQRFLDCPNVMAADRRVNFLNPYLKAEAKKRKEFLLVLETGTNVSAADLTTVDLRLIAEFPRPGRISILYLYRVTA